MSHQLDFTTPTQDFQDDGVRDAFIWKCLWKQCTYNNSRYGHEHCQGVIKNKRRHGGGGGGSSSVVCNNKILYQQYCHSHSDQARCFIPHCATAAMAHHNYCFDHTGYYKLYRRLADATDLQKDLLLRVLAFL